MATRPAWTIYNDKIISRGFDFTWNGGFALSQKQKNIYALHKAIGQATGESALEISSKGMETLGIKLSAFNLKLDGIYLENIFQAAKKYEKGGPYTDLLGAEPKDAKRDERHKTSGQLLSFVYNGTDWPLEPKTAFYDYIYVTAVIENFGYNLNLSNYSWFTDIEFNPKKSINCQARAIVLYKLLQMEGRFSALDDITNWIAYHKEKVSL